MVIQSILVILDSVDVVEKVELSSPKITARHFIKSISLSMAMVELLAQDVVAPDSKSNGGRTPLPLAARQEKLDVAKLLHEKYKESGIVVHKGDMGFATSPAAESSMTYNNCMSRIPVLSLTTTPQSAVLVGARPPWPRGLVVRNGFPAERAIN